MKQKMRPRLLPVKIILWVHVAKEVAEAFFLIRAQGTRLAQSRLEVIRQLYT